LAGPPNKYTSTPTLSLLTALSPQKGNTRKTWKRRFFALYTDGTLKYYKDEKEYSLYSSASLKVPSFFCFSVLLNFARNTLRCCR
jgi:hypothetical protein